MVPSHSSPETKEWLENLKSIYGQKRPTTPKPRYPRPKTSRRPKTAIVRASSSIADVITPIVKLIERINFPIISYPLQTIRNLRVGETSTELKMTPLWFEQEDQQEALKNIVYPPGIIDQRPFDSVARYRAAFNKTNNFRKKTIKISKTSTETLIIALDKFAQQFGGYLSFTNKEISFNQSAYWTACGIATLGSVHLLATNYIPTARFAFNTNLDYKKDLAKSDETMANFYT